MCKVRCRWSVKLPAPMLAGFMSSVNVAVTAVLAGTPVVGPGTVVARNRQRHARGRVVSGAIPVVKRHTKGATIARPVTLLRAPVTVAV